MSTVESEVPAAPSTPYDEVITTHDGRVVKLELLPTGKPHISFSETSAWMACSYRHMLKHVKKIDLYKPSIHPIFGTAVHATMEHYTMTRVMDRKLAFKVLKEGFDENPDKEGFTVDDLKTYIKEMNEIFDEVPTWLDEAFPGWEGVAAEFEMYEPIEGKPNAFKGFIDAVIKVPKKDKQGEYLYWLLDWKTCVRFWSPQKKSDPKVTSQLIYYKSFWSKKMNVPLKDVRTGFVLLKRQAKIGSKIEIVPVSVGEKSEARALKILNNMISSVNRGIAIKNREECKWCDYKNTEHCK